MAVITSMCCKCTFYIEHEGPGQSIGGPKYLCTFNNSGYFGGDELNYSHIGAANCDNFYPMFDKAAYNRNAREEVKVRKAKQDIIGE